jgi:FMN phosphatase YigB (HAD superfamily)
MHITLLIDLDDTLLDTNMPAFLPAYYGALARYLADIVSPDAMLRALRAGVDLMIASRDPLHTLQQVFEAEFNSRLGACAGAVRAAVPAFYETVFPALGGATRRLPAAAKLIDWALDGGHHVALATDPLFPLAATEARVRWAGLDPQRFALISSFESFHFTKSHPAYFAEILGRLGWPDRPVVMAGNDVKRDLSPAQQLGLVTYHVNGCGEESAARSGDLTQLRAWLESDGPGIPAPAFGTREAVLALLEATPAVLHGMTRALGRESWTRRSAQEDWAMIEIACHLRDTELEVHAAQIKTLIESAVPFVARPDAAVWAKQRNYLAEKGSTALREFGGARTAALEIVRSLPHEIWGKPARHSIFGPTNFLEVLGFMAEHDRLHLKQAWRALQPREAAPYRI